MKKNRLYTFTEYLKLTGMSNSRLMYLRRKGLCICTHPKSRGGKSLFTELDVLKGMVMNHLNELGIKHSIGYKVAQKIKTNSIKITCKISRHTLITVGLVIFKKKIKKYNERT